ncbi:MAG TPA: metallophosphoesterase, partial [Anaerolineaceae bacterium]|nr:metallophosphoesterase [Anaerolineaceae bacterium]
MKIAAIADIHCRVTAEDEIATLLGEVRQSADLLIIAGDLTDNGQTEEAQLLVSLLRRLAIPVIAILGNHDHEAGLADEIVETLTGGGVIVLDGTVYEIGPIGFAGTKGFCGGFGNCIVQPFGEKALKKFVQVGIEEAINLENALAKMHCEHKIVMLHYAPIPDTLEGEPPELYPFLGSTRFANAVDRQGADV